MRDRKRPLAPVGSLLISLILPTMLTAQARTGANGEPEELEPVRSSITVLENIEAETPTAVTVLNRTRIEQQPGVNLDDRLRAVTGFTLFRRTSSLVANPTTQGVSLRGLGSSGASRTLVLWDGVPVNDPFGGWVYWTRIAPEEVARVEISKSASTSVFGDRAMSGAISLFSRPAEPYRLTAGYEGGNLDSHIVTAGGSHVWSRFAASANVRAFATDGYFIVPETVRGSVDRPAGVDFVAGVTRLDLLGGANRLFVKLDILAEDRANGTELGRNSTSLGTLSGNYSREWNRNTVSVLAYHTREEYRASFTAVAAGRSTERITFLQTVPSEAVGGAGIFQHGGSGWNLAAGADFQRVEGTSTDRLVPTGLRVGGGSQFQNGQFAQLDWQAGPARLFAGGRHHRTGQDQHFFNPSAGAVVGRGMLRARGTVFRSFRAPTLNELFREFRVGNAVTQANPALRPETTVGVEAGFDVVAENGRLGVTLYRQSLEDLVTNVTLSSTPTLIVRQRQNAAEALTRGVDVDLRLRWRRFNGDFGYLFADSRFGNGSLIPQVPRHQGNAFLSFVHSRGLISAGVRSFGPQFEDDRNTFLLAGYAAVQFAARHQIRSGLYVTGAIENLLDREYLVGASPTPLIGAPRLWRLGLRWDGPVWR